MELFLKDNIVNPDGSVCGMLPPSSLLGRTSCCKFSSKTMLSGRTPVSPNAEQLMVTTCPLELQMTPAQVHSVVLVSHRFFVKLQVSFCSGGLHVLHAPFVEVAK